MAIYMLMVKDFEDEKRVVYSIGPNENTLGKIEYNKIEKKTFLLQKVDDEKIPDKMYVQWATQRIGQILYREDGKFPDRTSVER
ncbi:hypothetical protein ACYSNR_02710 [Enterococcus sp. LJL128]